MIFVQHLFTENEGSRKWDSPQRPERIFNIAKVGFKLVKFVYKATSFVLFKIVIITNNCFMIHLSIIIFCFILPVFGILEGSPLVIKLHLFMYVIAVSTPVGLSLHEL